MDKKKLDLYHLSGPGVVYSRNTLQNFVDMYVLFNPATYANDLEFINLTGSKLINESDIAHLGDLKRTRQFFIKNIKRFFPKERLFFEPKFVPPLRGLFSDSLPAEIADQYIYPMLEYMTNLSSDMAEKVINSISTHIFSSEWNGNNDIANLSNKIISVLENIFIQNSNNEVIRKKIGQLWPNIFQKRGIIDDLLRFLNVWIDCIETPIDVSALIKDIENSSDEISFMDTIIDSPCTPYVSSLLTDTGIKENKMECSRVSALYKGFLYVADNVFGLVKLGTGLNGSVFSSFEIIKKYEDIMSQMFNSMFCVSDYVFLVLSDGSIKIYDSLRLLPVTFDKGTFRLSTETENADSKIESNIDLKGSYFTSFNDKIYSYDNGSILVYDSKLSFCNKVEIIEEKILLSQYRFITNSKSVIFFTQKKDISAQQHFLEYSLRTGKLIKERNVKNTLTSHISIDSFTRSLIDINNPSSMLIKKLPISLFIPECFIFSNEDESIITVLRKLPYLLISRVSHNENLPSYHYWLSDINKVYETLDIILQKKDSSNSKDIFDDIIESLLLLIVSYKYQFRSSPDPSVELVTKALNSVKSSETKIHFFAVLLDPISENFDKMDVLPNFLKSFSNEEIVMAVTLMDSLAISLTDALLQRQDLLSNNVDQINNYSFIQKIIYFVTYQHYILNKSSERIFCVFLSLRYSSSHLFYSIFACLMPLLILSLKNPVFFGSVIEKSLCLINDMYVYNQEDALKEFANHHGKCSTDNPTTLEVHIVQPTHTYLNSTNECQVFDFKNAINIDIEFDQGANNDSYSWLQIFTDHEHKCPLTERLSGRSLTKLPQKISTNERHLEFVFKSDSSVSEYGYKAKITCQVFKQQNYESPDQRYDIYYEFYNSLLESIMMLIDDNSECKLKRIAPIIQLALNKIEKGEIDLNTKDLVEISVLGCPEIGKYFDTTKFNQIAVQLLFCAPHGVEFSNDTKKYEKLFTLINRAQETTEISDSKLEQIREVLKQNNLTLQNVRNAASKACLVYHFSNNNNKNEKFLELWILCMSALSKIKCKPSADQNYSDIESLGIKLDSNFDKEAFLNMYHQQMKRFADEKVFGSCQDEYDIPAVSVILSCIDRLYESFIHINNCKEKILSMILDALLLDLPCVVPKIIKIIQMYELEEDDYKNLEPIISKINDSFPNILKLEGREFFLEGTVFNLDFSYCCSVAYCVRYLLTEKSLNNLAFLIDKYPFGVLMVLSARSFPFRVGARVILKNSNNSQKNESYATIINIDPIKIHLLTDDGIYLSENIVDFQTLTPYSFSFELVHPSYLKIVSRDLMFSVLKYLHSDYGIFASATISELIYYAEVNYVKEIFKELTTDENKKLESTGEVLLFKELTLKLNIMGDCNGKDTKFLAWIYNKTVKSFKLDNTYQSVKIGFCEKDNSIPTSAFLVEVTANSVFINNIPLVQFEIINSISIGYLINGMRVYLEINGVFKLTDIYLPPMKDPIPLIIVGIKSGLNIKEIILDKNTIEKHKPVINPTPKNSSPIFFSHFLLPSIPSHILLNKKLVDIDSIFEPIEANFAEPIKIQLIPALSKEAEYFYFEFSFGFCLENMNSKICLSSSLFSTIVNYSQNISTRVKLTGLYINLKKGFVFKTEDGKIVEDSCFFIPKYDTVVFFEVSYIRSVYVNTGSSPFQFSLDKSTFPVPKQFQLQSEFFEPIFPLPAPNPTNSSKITYKYAQNLSPYTIGEISTVTSGKAAFGKVKDDEHLIVNIRDGKSWTITSTKVPISSCNLLLENLSNSMISFQYNTERFLAAYYQAIYGNSPIIHELKHSGDNCFYRWVALSSCILKLSVKDGMNAVLNFFKDRTDFTLSQFIVESVTKTSNTYSNKVVCHEIVQQLLGEIFTKEYECIDELCQIASAPFLLGPDFFREFPLYTICPNKHDKSKITLNNTDSIIFVPETIRLSSPKLFKDNYGNLVMITEDTKGILGFMGDTITFDSLEGKDFITVYIIPNTLRSPHKELNITFSTIFISKLVEFVNNNPKSEKLKNVLDQRILYPLIKHIMSGRQTNLFDKFTDWILVLFNKNIFDRDMLRKYVDVMNLKKISSMCFSRFSGILCIFAIYVNSQRNINSLIHYSVGSTAESYSSSVFRQLCSYNNLSFYKSKLFDFGKRPIVSPSIIEAFSLVKRKRTFLISSSNKAQKFETLSFKGSDRLAVVKIFSKFSVTINVNQTPVTPNKMIDLSGSEDASLKATKFLNDHVLFSLLIAPLYPVKPLLLPESNKLGLILEEMRVKWTAENEAFARKLAYTFVKIDEFYIVSALPDALCSIMFPNITPDTSRFAVALNICNFIKVETQKDAISGLYTQINEPLMSIILNNTLFKNNNTGSINLPHILPTKNSTVSMFFLALYRATQNFSVDKLLQLSDETETTSHKTTTVREIMDTLPNDLFYDRYPMADATSSQQIQGFVGFGLYAAICIANGRNPPLSVSPEVISVIIGASSGDTIQLRAIRFGAQCITKHIDDFRAASIDPVFCYYQELMSTVQVNTDNLYFANIISNPLFSDLIIKKVLGRKICTIVTSDKFEFEYNKESCELVIPSHEILIETLSKG